MNIEPDLHAASDAVLTTLDRLRSLELEKRRLPIGSPRVVELAAEIERLAAEVLGTTDVQKDLAHIAADQVRPGRLEADTTIESMAPAPRDVHTVLGEWRDAERRLVDLAPGSVDHDRLRDEIETLRSEYRRAHDAALRRTAGAG